MRRFGRFALFLFATCLLAGCGTQAASRNNGRFQVVATVGMVADIVQNVGGDHVDITQLMGAGVDPHLYVATRDDISAIMEADIVFYNGLMLEGKMTDILEKVSASKPVHAVTKQIDERKLLQPEEFAGHFDPHVWMDASLWSQCIGQVAEALGTLDPDHKAEYDANAQAYRMQVQKLDDYGVEKLSTIPETSRLLVTSHDAFSYFGRAYGVEVLGIQGLSTESEAGLQRINELVDLLVERKVKAVFVESSVPSKNIEALIDGARARGHEVSVGGTLFSDAMGPEGTYEGTYVGMLDHNITTVARALGGDAPERGMQSKLAATNDAKPAH